MPNDLPGFADEFYVSALGMTEEEAAALRLDNHKAYAASGARPRAIRCRLLGCKGGRQCEWWPACGDCVRRCRRCGQPVTRARLLRPRSKR